MKRDRIRNMIALGFVAVLFVGGIFAISGATLPQADFSFVNPTEIESIDPKKVSGVPEGRVLRLVLEGLTVADPKTLEPLPGMAESWDISEDGRTYTFHIRDDARWSDGSRVTAHDFYYSWKRFLTPDPPAKYSNLLWQVVNGKAYNTLKLKDFSKVGIKAPNDRDFVVQFEHPVAYFLDLTSFYPLFPVHKQTVERHPQDWYKPEYFVGNGPFLLAVRSIRDRLRVVKNPNYWDAKNVKLQTIDVLAVEDRVTALNLYLTGTVDWITDIPIHVVTDLKERPDFQHEQYLGNYFYRINLENPDETKRKFLGDVRVRKALYFALNRKQICKQVTKAGEVPARSIVPPGLPGYEGPKLPDYDPKKAKELFDAALADLGMSKPPPLTILYNTSDAHRDIAEVLQSQWRKALGIEIRLDNQEWGSYMAAMETRQYDIARGGWIGDYSDPNTFLDLWRTGDGNNHTGYSDKEYDDLIGAAGAEKDPAKRLKILAKAEQRVLDAMIVLPIYYYVTKNMIRPWVKGWYHNNQDMHYPKFIWVDKHLRALSAKD